MPYLEDSDEVALCRRWASESVVYPDDEDLMLQYLTDLEEMVRQQEERVLPPQIRSSLLERVLHLRHH